MSTFLGLLCFAGLLVAFALLRWLRSVQVHDATVLIPRSMPCLAAAGRRPSDEWSDEAIDRMADALEVLDEDLDDDLLGAELHFEQRAFLTGRDPGDESDEHEEGFV